MPKDSRVILLYGDDEYAISRRLSEFGSMFSDRSTADMNTARLDARTVSQDDLNNAVNALPFLARQRLVLLANPSAGAATPETEQKFLDFLEKVPETAVLVLWEHTESQAWGTGGGQRRGDQKHWLAAWLAKRGLDVEYYAQPAGNMMQSWIVKNAKSQGGEFSGPAAVKLAELVGADTRQAAQEVTKLLTYVDWKRAVTPADVEALTPFTAEADVWKMVDALSTGDGKTALQLLRRYIQHDGEFYAWSMIVRQFRLMLLAREVLDAGGRQAEAEKALGLKGYPAQKALEHARRFSMTGLERVYHRLLEIDEAAKTGRMPLELGMEILVAELTT
jgi:DNA polymerase-3 subunit delta